MRAKNAKLNETNKHGALLHAHQWQQEDTTNINPVIGGEVGG